MKRKNIGYVRVSTKEQALKGFSIGEQTRELLSHAASLGEDLAEESIYADKGFSATSLKRPKMQKILRMIANDEVENLFVINSDRLTRNRRNQDSLKFVFRRFNVNVISVNADWNTQSIDDEFRSDLKTLMDELEVKKISPRTYRGLKGSAKDGNYTIGGTPPRGYQRIQNKPIGKEPSKGSKIFPIPEYEKYIIFIFDSLIARQYNKSSLAKLFSKHKVMGLKWTEDHIDNIANNPIYYGRLKTSYCDIKNHTTPIISEERWYECQEALKQRNKRTNHFYIYNKLVYCPHCHSYCSQEPAWKTSRDKKKKTLYHYYKCPICNQRINENTINKKVAFALESLKLPSDKLKALEILYAKKHKIDVRMKYLESDFDEGLFTELDYREKYREALIKSKKIDVEIHKIEDIRIGKFNELSFYEKRSVVLENIKRIDVDLCSPQKEVSKIVYLDTTKVINMEMNKSFINCLA